MKQDFRKRVGFYLKKSDVLLESMSLSDFHFTDINDVKVITHDNLNKSIIHERLHSQEDLAHAVKKSEKFEEDVRDPENVMSIIRPEDFTEEFENQRKKVAKKNAGEVDMDEFLAQSKLTRASVSRNSDDEQDFFSDSALPQNSSSKKIDNNEQGHDSFQKMDAPEVVTEDMGYVDTFTHQKQNLDKVGKAISKVADKLEEITAHPSEVHVESDVAAKESNIELPVVPQAVSESQLEEIRNQGYQEGYKLGEEKATLEFQNITTRVVGDIEKIITDLQKVKSKVLHNIQDNFYEVCQALAEALIGREFQIHPESFATVVNKAIDESLREDEFTIAVHPDFYEKLQAVQDESFKRRLIKDNQVSVHDFRIDAKLSVVEGKIKELIADLLRETDMQIFAKKEAS